MFVDLQVARRLVAWGLGIAALTPFLLSLQPPPAHPDLYSVTGRVTYAGHPITNMYICIDVDGEHSSFSALRNDGSFSLMNFLYNEDGALAGRYRAHLGSYDNAPALPARYEDSRTSGLVVDVASDWTYLDIDLH